MPPVIAQIAVSAFISAGVGIASSAISGAFAKKPSARTRNGAGTRRDTETPTFAGDNTPLAQSAEPGGAQIGVIGRRRVGGHVVLSSKSADATYLVLLIAGGRCPVNAVYLNNSLVSLDANGNVVTAPWATVSQSSINVKLYTGDQLTADPMLQSAFPGWTASMIGYGQTYARIRIRSAGFDEAFRSGVPDFTFDVSGFPVFDPRDPNQGFSDPNSYGFTNNAALVAATYMTHELGARIPYDSIDWDTVKRAADICDELVEQANGLLELRYAASAYWRTNESHEAVFEKLEAAFAGAIYLKGAKWVIEAGEFDATGAPTITPNDYVAGGLAFADTQSIDDAANGVRGRFASPTNNYELRDFPSYQDAAALAEDQGREQWLTVDFEYVTSAAQAQRLARIAYNRLRNSAPASVSVNFSWFDVTRGDIVTLNDPLAGINTTYRVQEESLTPEFDIEFDLFSETAAMYAWNPATDELPMPAPVNLASAGGVGVNPDDTGPLQPPGMVLQTSVFVGTSENIVNAIAYVSQSPSSRATHYDFERIAGGGIVSHPVASTVGVGVPAGVAAVGAPTAAFPENGYRVRSRVESTGETSDWAIVPTPGFTFTTIDDAPNNVGNTSVLFVLPPAPALRIQAQGVGAAVINYFAGSSYFASGGANSTDQIEIWRNTTNAPGGTLLGTFTNANGTLNETQPAGSTRYYFARVRNTASGRTGPWSNALLVAY